MPVPEHYYDIALQTAIKASKAILDSNYSG